MTQSPERQQYDALLLALQVPAAQTDAKYFAGDVNWAYVKKMHAIRRILRGEFEC